MVLQEWVERETEELIAGMKAKGYLTSPAVERAVRAVPRWIFVPRGAVARAYRDLPLEIGAGQTISQPSTVVIMTEALRVEPGARVLEIGAGSGWQAGIIARLVGSATKVYTIERLRELALTARRNLEEAGIDNVEVRVGDGSEGLKDKAPFDRIIVTAAVPEIPPPLLEQLAVGGRMVLPIGDLSSQRLVVVEKVREGLINRTDLGPFVFVPLIGRYGFKPGR